MGKRPASRRRRRGQWGWRSRSGTRRLARKQGAKPGADGRGSRGVGGRTGAAVRNLPPPGTRPQSTPVSHARRPPVVVRVAWQCRVHAAGRWRRVRTAPHHDLDRRGRSRFQATGGSDSAHRAIETGRRRTRQTRITYLAEAPPRGRTAVCSGRAPCVRDRRASRQLSRWAGNRPVDAHDAPMVRAGAVVDPLHAAATASTSVDPGTAA